ncbi:preprotein translocase subunit SecG [Defluviitalea raffinosedens]|uniref:Protein-export membrane protein SecG n=2 Tax=Defluviitalea raffinosedens TaxID=1450156 RepID=A0A7C8LJ88_9FIRM|nr:preprotein translocase subunit SecG [Defluviitalea raffinosedens]HHW66144.1 preprotein translocase subunit SecG [Candidatus Epulonipiscium sp.]
MIGGVEVNVLSIILSVIYVLLAIGLITIVLLQEGKSAGLGSIGGAAETYWGKNKARSLEGTFEKYTKIGAGLFIVLALILNILIK